MTHRLAIEIVILQTERKQDVVSIPGDGLLVTWEPGLSLMTADASDLGLRPGQWPPILEITGPNGLKKRFYLEGVMKDGTRRYSDGGMITFDVMND